MKIITKNCEFIQLQKIVDERDGVLNIAEAGLQIPFEIKRVYFITDLDFRSAARGHHAHKELQQVIFCINGSFKLVVHDGSSQQEILLDTPEQGIFLGKKLWHTMSEFSVDCIILVLASDEFNESDYIRDFNEFKQYLKTVN